MKSLLTLLVILLGDLVQPCVAQADPARPQATLITNVNVIPMTSEQLLLDQQVLIKAGRIHAIGVALLEQSETDDLTVIDAEGGYLIPGLAEMHAHIPAASAGQTAVDEVLKLYLVNGIVLARGMLGEAAHLALRRQLADGQRIGPELVTSGPSLSGQSVSSRLQAVRMVRAQQADGYDFIKLHPGLSRDQYQAAASEGRRLNVPLAGHVSVEVGLELVLSSHQATIDHLDGYARALLPEGSNTRQRDPGFFGAAIAMNMDFAQIDRLARQSATAGVWNVPTETLLRHTLGTVPVASMLAWPEMRYMDAGTRQRWADSVKSLRNQYSQQQRRRLLAMRQQLLQALHREGAGLLLGSDAPQIMNVPGFSIHRELQAMVDAGLSPYAALAMGTRQVGEFFQRPAWGTVQPGAPANLVLLTANPLKNIGNTRQIAGVLQQGKWYDRNTLDSWLAAIAKTD